MANTGIFLLMIVSLEHPNYPDGVADNTHFNELGARRMAQLVWEGMKEQGLPLAQNITTRKK